MAPPSTKRPFGAVALTRLPSKVLSLEIEHSGPVQDPATDRVAGDVRQPGCGADTVAADRRGDDCQSPQLSMPPPPATAAGHGPDGQGGPGTLRLGATLFARIALCEIVTVAPGPKLTLGGISTPPPVAKAPASPKNGTDTGLVRETPPVMVTPLMDTVGSVGAPNVPMVSTGPPPRMVVDPFPDPTRFRLEAIVKPPV